MIFNPTRAAMSLLNHPLALHAQALPELMCLDFSGITPDDVGSVGYTVVEGVALVSVAGVLVPSLGSVYSWGAATGYDGIRFNVMHALNNPKVRAVAMLVSSGGGSVEGCFDLVDALHAARGQKPVWAILSESAYSAAYALASACDRITVPRTGGTGSVGVICAHVDMSKALDKAGLTVNLITYGAHKADGSEYQPLSDPARARLQADVDVMGDLFVATVARNRKLTPAQVKATQAATYMGAAGVDAGFADAVMAPDEAFQSLLSELG